ncbi:alkyl/aryl-sulfatase [Youngiibacter fragilis]|uniref:Metallo-beta-lactamase n=1 Tax=Youngiibacter fragilis 232.1 TaxID=994573 RepID=V7I1Y4_9CLOT|nr:alkyl/aryl-sulfatase [Youngiibacter fragilis]ETA79291.1 metallo-beta-lactamase [Youngiibacter fragilis 232.1]
MLGEQRLIRFTEENYGKQITKVNDRIYHFLGFDHSNAVAIIGDTSVILVDTLDSDGCAEEMKAELLKITDKPVRTIIYTHGHPDHRGGAGAFRETAEEIIAFLPQKPILKHYDRLNGILAKRGTYQHGYGLTDEEAICQGIGIREGKETGKGRYDFINPTTSYSDKVVERIIDGVRIRLVSAIGESDDQIYIWLEDDRVICTGDNYYGCWPNLYAIRGTQYRDIATWIDSLDEILSYDSAALLPGHTKPLIGNELIREQVGTFRDAIEFVLLTTLGCMNRGMTMSEAVEHVKLPMRFADKDYLGEYYGTVEWSVRSIFTGYLGWFDGNPAKLMPVSDREINKVLLEMIGEEKLLVKIRECMEKEEYQLALQLLELTENNDLNKEALLMRAKQMTSANARHYLIASAKEI